MQMTISRIRGYVAKFDDRHHVPVAISMVFHLLGVLDGDTENRVQSILCDLLESEKQHRADQIALGQWMTDEIEHVRRQERHRASRICELCPTISDAQRLILDGQMHVQGGAA